MFREATPHGCLRLSRREALMALIGVMATAKTVPAQKPPGFHVTGIVSESSEAPEIFMVGTQFGLLAAPGTAPHRLLTDLVDLTIAVHVDP